MVEGINHNPIHKAKSQKQIEKAPERVGQVPQLDIQRVENQKKEQGIRLKRERERVFSACKIRKLYECTFRSYLVDSPKHRQREVSQ